MLKIPVTAVAPEILEEEYWLLDTVNYFIILTIHRIILYHLD